MNKKIHNLNKIVLTSMLFATCLSGSAAFAQTTTIRSYASRQGTVVGGIAVVTSSNLGYAVDTDPSTSSNITLGVGIGASYTQFLDFNPSSASTGSYATTIPANTPITIKFSLPAGLVGALGNVQIQAITNLHTTLGAWNATNVGPAYSGSSLVGLLSGSGTMEYTITPTTAFQGISITMNGLASVGVGMNIYDAYIKVPATSIVCSSVIDELDGVRAGGVTLANATGSVNNPINVIDNSTSNYATLNTGAQVLSQVYYTTIFNTPSKVGDSLKIVIQDASLALLNLSALTGLQINLYNGSGSTPVQTLTNTSNLLTLNLLDGVSNIQELDFVPTAVFDRAELVLGGVASAFQTLRLYGVNRKNAGVSLTTTQKDVYAYAGQNFTLNGTSIATGDLVNYYDALTGGNQLASNIATTLMSQSSSVVAYYAGTSRSGCSENSDRKQINGHISGFTKTTPVNGSVGSPYSSSVKVTIDATAVMPLTPSYTYSTVSTLPPGLTLNSTNGNITGTPSTSGNYPLDVTVTDQANNLPVGTFTYNIVISSIPLASNLLTFEAEGLRGMVKLDWTIAPDAENKAYEIERSADAKSFNKIGSIASDDKVVFEFIDKDAINGTNYYRLKIIGANDKLTYSNIVSANVDEEAEMNIFPNPIQGNVLYVKGENVKNITISNSIGQLVSTPIQYGTNLQVIQTQLLNKGLYFITVKKYNGEISSYRLIVK